MRNGFTIIELLSVCAIIAVLAGLLFPVFSKAMERAYLTTDVSQMRQIYVASSLYEEDNGDAFSPSLLYVEPYAHSTAVFMSPVDPFKRPQGGATSFPADVSYGPAPLWSPFRISYAYLPPMAAHDGFDAQWLAKAAATPAYGLIACFMYNVVYHPQPPTDIDLFRWMDRVYRIKMDGSYEAANVKGRAGVVSGCSLEPCFGLVSMVGP